jgi:hypothetical protein
VIPCAYRADEIGSAILSYSLESTNIFCRFRLVCADTKISSLHVVAILFCIPYILSAPVWRPLSGVPTQSPALVLHSRTGLPYFHSFFLNFNSPFGILLLWLHISGKLCLTLAAWMELPWLTCDYRALASCNVLVQWYGLLLNASGFVPLSMADFSL